MHIIIGRIVIDLHYGQAKFLSRIIVVRERMESREREIHGSWLTEERMQKSGEFSEPLGTHVWCMLYVSCV